MIRTLSLSASLTTATPQARKLAVFDVDGTLLVSHGREIVQFAPQLAPGTLAGDELSHGEPMGEPMRVALHPLLEVAVRPFLPEGCRSDFSHSGEEDQSGDPHSLIQKACVVEPVAEVLRTFLESEHCDVALLTARGHSPEWLADELYQKLRLTKRIRPELVKCVYSSAFDARLAAGGVGDGVDSGTSARKAFAIAEMIDLCSPAEVRFYDDMKENLEGVKDAVTGQYPHVGFYAHLVPFELSLDACEAAGVDVRELIHPQCRDEHAQGLPPNPLVQKLLKVPSAQDLLGKYMRPEPPTGNGGLLLPP